MFLRAAFCEAQFLSVGEQKGTKESLTRLKEKLSLRCSFCSPLILRGLIQEILASAVRCISALRRPPSPSALAVGCGYRVFPKNISTLACASRGALMRGFCFYKEQQDGSPYTKTKANRLDAGRKNMHLFCCSSVKTGSGKRQTETASFSCRSRRIFASFLCEQKGSRPHKGETGCFLFLYGK